MRSSIIAQSSCNGIVLFLFDHNKFLSTVHKMKELKQPGFPDQADHSLTIVWRHTNHTKFRI